MAGIITLSKRLNALSLMAGSCDTFTDVGTDHGLLPLYLIQNGKCKRAVASDINEGPLDTARANAKVFGIEEDKISFVLSDGLDAIDTPVNGYNVLTVSGMGGLLIKEILEKAGDKLKYYDSFILSPHTKQYEFRRYLTQNGFVITDEAYIAEDNKLYVIIKAEHDKGEGISSYSDDELRFGRFINKALTDDEIRKCLTERYLELKKLSEENKDLPEERRAALSEEAQSYREVLRN